MFVNSDYLDYHYVVSLSDNYVVLTDRGSVNGSWENPVTISTVTQYFEPSIVCIEGSQIFSTSRSFNSVEVTDEFYSRADCPELTISIFCWTLFMIFIINGLTKFVKKGGLFFG